MAASWLASPHPINLCIMAINPSLKRLCGELQAESRNPKRPLRHLYGVSALEPAALCVIDARFQRVLGKSSYGLRLSFFLLGGRGGGVKVFEGGLKAF